MYEKPEDIKKYDKYIKQAIADWPDNQPCAIEECVKQEFECTGKWPTALWLVCNCKKCRPICYLAEKD